MASAKLFIHIGAPKTGTTLLQRAATEQRDRLAEHGLLYPKSALRGFGHHDFAFLLDGGYPDWAKPQTRSLADLEADLATECHAHSGDILLSSEDFYLFPQPGRLRDLVLRTGLDQGRDVRIIVYVRRQDEAMESWYNQLIKAQGYSGSPEDALEQWFWLWDYATEIDRWAATFGREALMVCDYHEATAGEGGLVADFWSRVAPAMARERTSRTSERINIGLNRDLLEIQKIINRLPISIVEKRDFHQDLMTLTEKGGSFFSTAPVYDAETRHAIMKRHAAGNAAVGKTWFGKGTLFPPADGMRATAPYPGLDQEKIIATLAWLLLKRDC